MIDYSKEDPKKYYDEHGYFVVRGLVPQAEIDAILSIYERDIKTSSAPFFRQSANRWEKNRFNEFGYSQSSFLDIHDYENFPEFTTAARRLYCSKKMRETLAAITGSPAHNLMQTMLFDQNTATPPHQDHYYLDSVPNGHLIAAWIAMEDIDERAGRFFVVAGTNNERFQLSEEEKISNKLYTDRIRKFVDANRSRVVAPELKKGDVLFWHAYTVHGSQPTLDKSFSRKSLTAHYLPSQYEFGNMHNKAFPVRYGEFEGMKFRRNEKFFSIPASMKYEVWNFLDKHPSMRKVVNQIKGAFT